MAERPQSHYLPLYSAAVVVYATNANCQSEALTSRRCITCGGAVENNRRASIETCLTCSAVLSHERFVRRLAAKTATTPEKAWAEYVFSRRQKDGDHKQKAAKYMRRRRAQALTESL